MKLHLPKLLCVAVLAACSTVSYAEDINVGKANKYNDFYSNLTTTNGNDLTVTDGQRVGYYAGGVADPESFVTSFGSSVSDTVTNSLLVGKTHNLYIAIGYEAANLTIQGSGQVYLGGQNGPNQFAGLVAKDVVIDSTATGTKEAGKANLWADSLTVDKFTINGGTAYIRTREGGGNKTAGNAYSKYGYGVVDSAKSATITGGLYINGGYLMMGRHANGTTFTETRAETNSNFVNIIKSALVQTGGEAELQGKTYIEASQIKQTGGTLSLATDPQGPYEYLRLGQDTTIHQDGGTAQTDENRVKLTVAGMIISGDDGKGSRKLTIEQLGNGIISLEQGVMFKGSESKISQSGGGKINLAGHYESATFDITQSDKGGEILLTGTMKSGTVNQSIGKLTVSGADAALEAKTINAGGSVISGAALTNGTLSTANGTVSNSGVLEAEKVTVNSGTLKVDGDNASLNAGTVNAGKTEITGASLSNGSSISADAAANVTITGALSVNNVSVTGGQLELAEDGYMVVNGTIVVGAGSTLVNNGTITGSSTYALMTADEQYAAVNMSAEDVILVAEGGTYDGSNGITEKDIIVEGGTVTLGNATTQDITMNSGTINVKGDVETGSLTLNGGSLIFEEGATVILSDSGDLNLAGVEIIINVEDVNNLGDTILFTTASGQLDEELMSWEGTQVTFKDENNGSFVGTISGDINGGSLSVIIPEPATATLSLLALAGLALRRRRAA